MFDLTSTFIRNDNGEVMEGFLYDTPQECVYLLFILREPDCENEQSFWLKKALHNYIGRGKNGNKIINTFTKLACFVLGKKDPEILRECAFINLYPYDGKPRADRDGGFFKTLKEIQSPSDKQQKYNRKDGKEINITEIADKRINLFRHLKDTNINTIVTVADIFNCISIEDESCATERIFKKNGKPFRIGSLIYNDRIKVFEYYHPSARCVNYQLLDDAIERRIASP